MSGTVTLGAVLGPLRLLAAFGKESTSIAFAVPDGSVHERNIDGNAAIRNAQREVVRFNAMAGATS